MQQSTRLIGLVSLGIDQVQAAQVAAQAIEKWHEAIAPWGKQQYQITLFAQAALRPQQKTIKAEGFLTSKKWASCRENLAYCAILSGSLPSGFIDPNGPPIDAGFGFTFGPGLRFILPAADTASSQFAVWADLRLPGIAIDALEDTLRSIVDDVMIQASGHQAFTAKWNWNPGFTIDMTPYEMACGVHGQCTTLNSWCSRFLRGVSNEVWLGLALLERLGDRQEIKAVAELRRVGNSLHLSLKQDADLNQLESVLAPLLPSSQDWKDGMHQLYGRSVGQV